LQIGRRQLEFEREHQIRAFTYKTDLFGFRQPVAGFLRKNKFLFEAGGVAGVAQVDAVENLRIFEAVAFDVLCCRVGKFQRMV
jgi:hypothetical protein